MPSPTSPTSPTRTELVRLELKAQRRALGVRQSQARRLRFRGEVADPLTAAGEGIAGIRHRKRLSIAFDTGLRRSELVAARWPHVERGSAGGGRLFVPRSKADQEGAAPMPTCPRARWRRWRRGAEPSVAIVRASSSVASTAPTTRRVWSVGTDLSVQSMTLVYRVMLDTARKPGLLSMIDATDFNAWRRALTAHSTRVGLTQDLFASGQELAGIMHALRWKSPAQPARYAQALAVGANAAARVVAKL